MSDLPVSEVLEGKNYFYSYNTLVGLIIYTNWLTINPPQ